MRVITYNNKKDVISNEEIREAIIWICKKLFKNKKLLDHITCKVFFKDMKTRDTIALCEDDPKEEIDDYRKNPRSFHIILNTKRKFSKSGIIRTLFHECSHLEESATGKLRTIPGYILYRKQRIKPSKADNNYWQMPWEIRAYGVEKCYYELWLDEKKNNK